MRVYKDTPFEFTVMPWEITPPRVSLLVVVKSTFSLVPGGDCTVAEQQVPCGGDVPWDDGTSLRFETDYSLLKTRAEWVLAGTAHAPPGQTVPVLPVGVRVGEHTKQAAVFGDRVWKRGLMGMSPSEPAPFASMPLRWERSFGGPQIRNNPVGAGTNGSLPNIEDPRSPMVSKDDRPAPVGFFPIPNTWPERRSRTGTYDEKWKRERWPFFPEDFDYEFFSAAPSDQRMPKGSYWRGDERIELTGLDPEHSHLKTRLPGLRPRAFVEWVGASPQGLAPEPDDSMTVRTLWECHGPPTLAEIALRCDTLTIDADSRSAVLLWRGLVPVADERLSNVARLFFLQEPIETDRPMAHYESWLLEKIIEEEEQFELGPEPQMKPPQDFDESGVQAAIDLMAAASATVLAAAGVEPRPMPSTAEVRARLEAVGVVPPDVLEEPPPVIPVEEIPPSLLRLEAIIRRKLRKSFERMDLSAAPYQKLDLSGVSFAHSILTRASLSGCNLRDCTFDGAVLVRAHLDGAVLEGASLCGAELSEMNAERADFQRAVLDGASGSEANFDDAIFRGASLRGTELDDCTLRRSDFREAVLDGASFSRSMLEESDFSLASLDDTCLAGARAARCNFERCKMPKLRASDGADFSGARFLLAEAQEAQLQEAVLEGANLAGANFSGADFSDARAGGIDMTRAVVRGGHFDRADLRGARMIQADLFEATFESAHLGEADLRGAHLFSAAFWRATTLGAHFDGAVLTRTLLEGK